MVSCGFSKRSLTHSQDFSRASQVQSIQALNKTKLQKKCSSNAIAFYPKGTEFYETKLRQNPVLKQNLTGKFRRLLLDEENYFDKFCYGIIKFCEKIIASRRT
jgi:hypothetical protein